MCNRLCMIMLFKRPIANKIQRSPFQYKTPLGTPASPPLCEAEAAFSWDPSQMIHRCLPESTFSHHASRKGGGFISSSTTGICWPFWVESKKLFLPIATISYSPETWCASVTGWVEVTGGWIGELPGTVRGHL